jgi:hypothetical protein
LILSLISVVLAAEAEIIDLVVLADSVPADVVQKRLAALKSPDAVVLSFTELMSQVEPVLSKGTLTRCEDTMSLDKVQEAAKRAEDAVLFNELEAAGGHLEKARVALSCATEPVGAALGASVYFFSGFVAAVNNDLESARVWFSRAHLFDPALAWDERLSRDHEAVFNEAVQSVYMIAPTRLYVSPDPEGRWTLDAGAPIADGDFFTVTAGEHLMQVGSERPTTFTVVFEGGETNLFLPQLAPAELARTPDLDDQREGLDEWLALAYPGPVYVATNDRMWHTVPGSGVWVDRWGALVSKRRRTRRGIAWTLTASGGGLAVGGGVWTGLLTAAALRKYDEQSTAETIEAEDIVQADYEALKSARTIPIVLTTAGAAVASTGVVLAVGF